MFSTLADIVLAPVKIGAAMVKGTAEVIDETLDLDD